MQASCDESCRQNCINKITQDERQALHDIFWNLGDHVLQWNYLEQNIKRFNPINEPSTLAHVNKTKQTRHYFLKKSNKVDQKVCKTMFLSTFDFTKSWLRTVSKKVNSKGSISPDRRGKHAKRENKVPDNIKTSVVDHINSFVSVESHIM